MNRSDFTRAVGVAYCAGAWVECPGDVVFDVLARCEHEGLLAALDVGQADARIKVDVGFIEIEYLVLGGGLLDQSFNVIKDFTPPSHRDSQGGPRPTAAALLLAQHGVQVRHREADAGIFLQLPAEQFEGPRTALPAVALRDMVQVP